MLYNRKTEMQGQFVVTLAKNGSNEPSLHHRKWPGEFDYTLNAPKGHLPLTNCLRGTQLFKAILVHPAFERPAENESSASSQPDWLNQTETKLSL